MEPLIARVSRALSRVGKAQLVSNRRGCLGVASFLALTVGACGSGQPSNAPSKPMNRSPAWATSTEKDAMTDRVSYVVRSTGNAPLSVVCRPNEAEIMILTSDLFLGSGKSNLMVRYGNEAPVELEAFTSKYTALFRARKDWQADDPSDALTGVTALGRLRKTSDRLRVRLTNLDGETRDLDFPVRGLAEQVRVMERQCGLDKDGNWPSP